MSTENQYQVSKETSLFIDAYRAYKLAEDKLRNAITQSYAGTTREDENGKYEVSTRIYSEISDRMSAGENVFQEAILRSITEQLLMHPKEQVI